MDTAAPDLLLEDEARELLAPIQGRIAQAVTGGAAQAYRRYTQDHQLAADATVRAMVLNQSIVSVAHDRLRGTIARPERIGNAWRWNVGERALLRFKKAGVDGWPVNNYSTRQSLQYVNARVPQQQCFLPVPDMLTVLYSMDMLDEHVVSIEIVRMRGKRDCSWSIPVFARTGIIPAARQESIPDLPAATRVRFKKPKKEAF
ncbi:MAG: hypothetical protein H0W41_00120 [Chloroflexi bacterium]|nr:hypothetical protein [Chloroflexota bacterium]